MNQITIQTGTQMKITTKNIPTWCVLSWVLMLALGQALGQTLPLEIRQDKTLYNYQSAGGVPISTTVDAASGSDGNAPTAAEQQNNNLTINPPTGNQFSGFISWGAVAAPESPSGLTATNNLGDDISYSGNAANIGLPRGGSGSSQVVLMRAQVGAPYLNRPVSFLFGGIIPPPEEDEHGDMLPDSVLPSTYWLGEPHLFPPVPVTSISESGNTATVTTTNPHPFKTGDEVTISGCTGGNASTYNTNHTVTSTGNTTFTMTVTGNPGAGVGTIVVGRSTDTSHEEKGYYYSIHARTVFAIQPGPLEIIWRKSTPASTKPTDYYDTDKWKESAGNYYRLHKMRYVVSGSASKTPKKIYWNQAGYNGPQVNIPDTAIGDLKIVYNKSFPEEVSGPGIPAQSGGATSSGGNTNVAVYKYTLSYDSGNLKALNAEGRVFVELLGDPREDGVTRVHLGYEIVDVFKHSTPSSVTTELGDLVQPSVAPVSENDELLHPEPLLQIGTESFTYMSGGFGGSKIRYYAARETKNLNDYQIHWMEEGLEGILWPAKHVRYKFIWPEDPARYSHYVRPPVTATRTALSTAVKLPLGNVPFIQYQDPLDGPRAHLSPTYEFYTELDANYPQHRTLLRFSSGENIYFERVFSWLESDLENTNIDQSNLGPEFWVPARDLKIWGASTTPHAGLKYDSTATVPITTLKTGFLSSDQLNAPRYITQTVDVGARIQAPTGELGASEGDYWAGYILNEAGDAYNEKAYIDPISEGFEAANKGAIIPVNADSENSKNILEVYWYRKNGADTKQGFEPIYWPAAFGRYTIQWCWLAMTAPVL